MATSTVAGADTGDETRAGERDTHGGDNPPRSNGTTPCFVPEGTTQYVAVVDRIVDGRHVVLLLEDGERVVDQLVEPIDRFDDIAEGDILWAVVTDTELRAYRELPSKPNSRSSPDPDFERLSTHE